MRNFSISPLAIGFVWFSGMTGPAALAQGPLKPADVAGAYLIVGGEKEGTQEPPERIKDTTVRFTEETIVVTSPDKREIYSATYTLMPSDKPDVSRIRMVSRVKDDKMEEAKGLISKDKDGSVKLIYALPGGEEPTEFRTKGQQLMFVMKPARE